MEFSYDADFNRLKEGTKVWDLVEHRPYIVKKIIFSYSGPVVVCTSADPDTYGTGTSHLPPHILTQTYPQYDKNNERIVPGDVIYDKNETRLTVARPEEDFPPDYIHAYDENHVSHAYLANEVSHQLIDTDPNGLPHSTRIRDFHNFQQAVHRNATEHGWYGTNLTPTFPEFIALVHSELSEALQEYRDGYLLQEIHHEDKKPEGIPCELADVVMRILGYCYETGIDLEGALVEKHDYNKTRRYRHGNKVI